MKYGLTEPESVPCNSRFIKLPPIPAQNITSEDMAVGTAARTVTAPLVDGYHIFSGAGIYITSGMPQKRHNRSRTQLVGVLGVVAG